MSENRTFTLIGKFDDGITPSLKTLNKELSALNRNFARLSSSFTRQRSGIEANIRALEAYTRSAGKVVAANMRIESSGTSAFQRQRNSVEASILGMQAYTQSAGRVVAANRRIEESARSAQAAARAVSNGGGRGLPPAGNIGGFSPAGGMGGGGIRETAAGVGGLIAGSQIANIMTGAIVRGFQIGVSFMQKPFQYAIQAFGERMKDEMSDIQSAGGMFAIDKRDKTGIFKGFEDARDFQKELNVRLAQSAGSLPGATSDYVQQAKQLTDNMMLAYSKNKKSFTEFAKTLGPVAGERDALGIVLQKFTEKSVLLGMGSGGSSMYGVPQILAMLLDQERVNVKSFNQFAAYQSNPLLKNALERAEPELAKTVKGSTERLKLIQKVLDEAVPNEVVMAMKNSLSGVKEAIRSGFLDPEAGLFGLGRSIDLSIPKVNALGQYLKKNGEVTKNLSEAARTSASLFDLLRDSLGGFALPLSELVTILPQIFDPLKGIATSMVDFRNMAQRFYRNFNQYVADFEALSKLVGGAAGGKIKQTAGARGALTAFTDLLVEFGAFKESDFTRISGYLKKPDVNFGAVGGEIFRTLFNSDFMTEVGKVIGSVIGSTLKMVGDLMAGVTNITEAGPFAKGLKEGWDKAKGAEGITNIFRSLLRVIFNGLVNLFKSAPLETSLIAGLTLGMPILQGAIGAGITAIFGKLLGARAGAAGSSAAGAGAAGAGAAGAGAAGGGAAGLGAFLTPSGARAARGIRGVAGFGKELLGLAYSLGGRPGLKAAGAVGGFFGGAGKAIGKVGQYVPGGALAFGAIDAGMRMASGQDAGKAIGGAAAATIGTTLGGILGQALIPVPGVGAAVGGIAGGIIADKFFNMLSGPSAQQKKAADLQLQASLQQVQAAGIKKSGVDVEKAGGQFLFGSADELSKRLSELGLSTDKAVRSFEGLYRLDESKQKAARKAGDALNAEIERLRKLGRSDNEIAVRVKGLQTVADKAKTEAQTSLTNLNTAWSKLGDKSTETILNSFKRMPVGKVEEAIAQRIRIEDLRGSRVSIPSPPTGKPRFKYSDTDVTAYGNVFTQPTFFKFAKGGSFRTGVMGEAGPEAVMPLRRAPGGKLGVIATGATGDVTVNAQITIHQQPGQNAEQLAALVAAEISNAIQRKRSSTMFV